MQPIRKLAAAPIIRWQGGDIQAGRLGDSGASVMFRARDKSLSSAEAETQSLFLLSSSSVSSIESGGMVAVDAGAGRDRGETGERSGDVADVGRCSGDAAVVAEAADERRRAPAPPTKLNAPITLSCTTSPVSRT